jgi:hypothetical protein
MINNTIKSTIIICAAIVNLMVAVMSDNIFLSKICASLAIITLATGSYLMQGSGKLKNTTNK